MEGDENFYLIIDPSSLPSGVSVSNPGQATVTIVDDDGKIIEVNIVMYLARVVTVILKYFKHLLAHFGGALPLTFQSWGL